MACKAEHDMPTLSLLELAWPMIATDFCAEITYGQLTSGDFTFMVVLRVAMECTMLVQHLLV